MEHDECGGGLRLHAHAQGDKGKERRIKSVYENNETQNEAR